MKKLFALSVLAVVLMQTAQCEKVGCYKENKRSRHFRISPGGYTPATLSPNSCALACSRFSHEYAAIAQGKYCFCADSIGLTLQSDSNCDKRCVGGEECGGQDHVTVYKVGGLLSDLSVTPSAHIVAVQEVVTFEITLTASLQVEYQFDYGDGAGETGKNDSLMYTKSFGTPGEYNVQVRATDPAGSGQEIVAMAAVVVEEEVGDVEFLCAEGGVTAVEVECNATITAGNSMEAFIKYGDGALANFTIADPGKFSAGPPVSDRVTANPPGEIGTIVMPASEFMEDGTLSAFELQASSSGAVEILILEPSCTDCYSFDDNSCKGPGLCSDLYQCTGDTFCPQSGLCSTGCSPPNRYSAAGPKVNYRVKALISHNVGAAGYNYIPSPQAVAIKKGYVLGFSSAVVRLGVINSNADEGDFQTAATPSLNTVVLGTGLTYVAGGKRHLLKAVTSYPVQVKFFHTYNTGGVYELELHIKNKNIAGSKTALTNVTILDGIGDIILNASSCVAVGQTVTVEVLPHEGDDIQYTWDWGDVSTPIVGPELVRTHTYTSANRYNVTVTARNLMSEKANFTEVCVEELITGIQITAPSSQALTPANFTLTLSSGSDFTCNWTTDGVSFLTTYLTHPSNSIVLYTYDTEGSYTVHVECYNMLGSTTKQVTHNVQEPIVGLHLVNHGALKGRDFSLVWTIDAGSDPVFNVTIGGNNPANTYDAATKTGTSSVITNVDDTGMVTVTIHAYNLVSELTIVENFTIEVEIRNVEFTCSHTAIPMLDSATFEVTMEDGSGVTIVIDYQDALATDTHQLDSGFTWPAGFVFSRVHAFTTGGRKNVTAVVSNNVDPAVTKWCMVDVITPIANISIISNSPVEFSPPAVANIWFEQLAGTPLALAEVELDYGDGVVETMQFEIGKIYTHQYFEDKEYTVRARIFNSVDEGVIVGTLNVVEPVVDLAVSANPKHAIVGMDVELTVSMYRGCQTGVKLYWDFGDLSTKLVTPESGICPNGRTTVTHRYAQVQPQVVTVRAENLLGNTSAEYTIYSQIRVPDLFSVVVSGSNVWPDGTVDVTKTFTLKYNSPDVSLLPNDATVTWEFGEGDPVTGDLPLFADFPKTYLAKYTSPGNYIAKVTIQNLASSIVYYAEAGIFEPITDLDMVMSYKPDTPPNAPLSTGEGAGTDIFPLDRPVIFNMTMTKGTVVKYVFEVAGTTVTEEFESSPFEFLFTTVGDYDITVRAVNPVEDIPAGPSTVKIRARNLGLKVNDHGIVTASGEKKSFTVSLDTIGTDSCLEIDYGDGSLNEVLGSAADCSVPSKHYVGSFGLSTKVDHIYPSIGNFKIKVTARNVVSNPVVELDFPVSYVVCRSPAIDILDRKVTFYDPSEVQRSRMIRVIGTTDLNCTKTFENTKTWEVWSVDSETGVTQGQIDVTALSSSRKAELAVPARFLEYGLYKIVYRVEMDSTKFPNAGVFSGESFTYVRVTKSDLIGNLLEGGMSMIKVMYGMPLAMNPGKYSIDPDLLDTETQVFDRYTWFCMKKGDRGFPRLPDGTYNTSFFSIPLTDPKAYTEDLGGCFRQGPGPIKVDTQALTINTVNFDVGATYMFMVIIEKDTRSTEALLSVMVTNQTVPSVIIECKTKDLCQQAKGGQKVNPSARLALVGRCKSGCDGTVRYEWTGLSYDYKWPFKPIPNFENYTWGTGSPEIAIERKLFEDFPDVSQFRIDLSVWEDGGEPGLSQIIIHVNQPPHNGTCTLTGNPGVVLADAKTTLSCKGWVDDDVITIYQFFVLFKGDDMEHQLVFGDDEEVSVHLPLGPDWDDFRMDVMARIYDYQGAYTTVLISTEQVMPSTTNLKQWVDELVSGASNEISLTVARADLLESCFLFQSLASVVNSASKGSVTEYLNTSVSAAHTPTGYGPGGVPKSHEPSVSEELEETAKQEKDDRAQLREQMIAGIMNVTTSNVASVALKASTVSSLGAYPDELTRQAQDDMKSVLVECAHTLNDLKSSTTKEELIAAATNILAGAGTLLVAAKYHYEDPLLSDLEKASLMDEYDTNRESKDEAIESLDPVEGRSQLTKSTNRGLQKSTADVVVTELLDAIKTVSTAVRSYLVPGEQPVVVITDQLALSLQKNEASRLTNTTIDEGRGSVKLPDWCTLQAKENCSTSEIVNLEIINTPSVPYGLTENAANLSFSSAIEINFLREDGSEVAITNSQKDIEMVIPKDVATVKGELKSAEPAIVRKWEYLYFHRSQLDANDSAIHVQMRPSNTSNQYLVFVRFEGFPNVTEGKWDLVQPIPHTMAQAGQYGSETVPDPYTLFLSNDKVPPGWTGEFFVGVRQLVPAEYNMYSPSSTFSPVTWTGGVDTFTGDYQMKIFTSSCVYYNKDVKDWFTDGCTVGDLTTESQTQCFCSHLTTFAGGLIVAPNAIDWNFIFANADFLNNPTLYVTEMVIAVVYILAMIWARRKDKRDVEDVGITPLPDNDAQDKYYYEIVVQTGLRSNAGTDSKVHFILSGEYEETDVRPLADPKRKILRRGGTDGFLLAVPRPLGSLNFVRIWHDNSGKGKFGSWYLKYFLVRDLQTGEKFYFICNRWFAVEEDDGQVDRVCPVAGPEQMMQFGHQFSQKTRRNLSDGHLWFSVIARPPRSRFTRVQRVSCCLGLLFLTMLANAMYYEASPAATGSNSFTFGPFALTPAELYIGVMANLIVFPISFIIIQLFRKSRPRKKRRSRIQEAIERSGVKLTDINPQMGSKWSLQQPQELNLPDRSNPEYRDDPTPRPGTAASSISNFRSETSMSGRITNSYYNQQKKRRDKAKTKRMLPWWCQIIAWILLFATVAVSVCFVTFYGIGFGDYKCKQWITSMLVAFLMSIFITQPIKVFLTAVVLSLIIRNPGEDDDEGDEDEEDPSLGHDEEFLHRMPIEGYGRPKKVAYKPPDPHTLEKARLVRMKEIQMWNAIREIVFYAFFLWVLMVISYGNRDPLSYLYKYSLERNFIGNNITSSDFRQVHNTKNFWNWTTNSLVPSIRAQVYYNEDPALYLRGYINDKVSRIMGYATMRQLRISKGTCRMEEAFEGIIESCNGDYLFWNEEKGSYGSSWADLNGTTPPSHYVYRDANTLNGYPYWGHLAVYNGGGYVVELRESYKDLLIKMNQLENEGWIDKFTRAVFIEFTVYNPGINLFAVSTLLAEWHPSAGVVASYRFEPVRLFPYMEAAFLFQIICEVAFVLFLVFFMYREIKCIIKEKGKYMHNFWNMVEISIIGVSITAVVIYFYRLIVSNQLTNVFKNSHGNDYMKFQYVGYWNEILSYMIGWLVFLSTLKFLKLLRFNRRMSMLAATLRNGCKSMFHFGIIFTIVFLAFIQLFYLVYHTNIYTFANFINSMEAGFLMMMGKFDIYSMMMMEPLITPVFFFLFVVTITFILVNMFVSILNESFSSVKTDISKQPNEYEIVDFMLGRFKQWTGLGGAAAPTSKSEDILLNNLKKQDLGNGKPPVEHFPDKVDELLNTISKAYFDQDNLENVLGPKTDADRMAMKNLLKKHAEETRNRPLSAVRTDKVPNFDPNTGQYRRF